jgi:hypothetical protein
MLLKGPISKEHKLKGNKDEDNEDVVDAFDLGVLEWKCFGKI